MEGEEERGTGGGQGEEKMREEPEGEKRKGTGRRLERREITEAREEGGTKRQRKPRPPAPRSFPPRAPAERAAA